MKFLYTILTLISISSSIINAQTTLSGSIQNVTAQTAVLYIYPTALGENGVALKTTIDNNNQFQFTPPSTIAVPAVLQIGGINCYLFLFPAQSLQIDIEIHEKGKVFITFNGEAAADNQFYLQYQNVLKQEQKNVPEVLKEKFKPKKFLVYQTDLKERKINYLNQHQSTIDHRLINWLKNDVIYQYANNLIEYPDREYLSQSPAKKYYDFLKELKYNNEAALLQPSYQRFILGYVHYQLLKPQGWGRYLSPQKQYKFVRRYFIGEVLHYLQFYIIKTSLELGEREKAEILYQDFLNSDAPKGYKQQLRRVHQLGNKNIIGQYFPTYILENLREPFFKDNLKVQNGKLFYVWQKHLRKDKISVIRQLEKEVDKSHRIDFGLIGLTTIIDFPKSLSHTPHFWITPYALENYVKNFPIREEAYLLYINKFGQVLEYTTSELTQDGIGKIVNFMENNYNKRVYSTLSNSFLR